MAGVTEVGWGQGEGRGSWSRLREAKVQFQSAELQEAGSSWRASASSRAPGVSTGCSQRAELEMTLTYFSGE